MFAYVLWIRFTLFDWKIYQKSYFYIDLLWKKVFIDSIIFFYDSFCLKSIKTVFNLPCFCCCRTFEHFHLRITSNLAFLTNSWLLLNSDYICACLPPKNRQKQKKKICQKSKFRTPAWQFHENPHELKMVHQYWNWQNSPSTCSWHQKTKPRVLQYTNFTNLKCCKMSLKWKNKA